MGGELLLLLYAGGYRELFVRVHMFTLVKVSGFQSQESGYFPVTSEFNPFHWFSRLMNQRY